VNAIIHFTMSYRFMNVFCAAARNLEEERQAFYRAVAECNELTGLARGVLYVPVSVLPAVSDPTRIQHAIDFNIRLTHFYIQVLDAGWAAAPQNFERDLRFALACLEDPALPMSQVAVWLKKEPGGLAQLAEFLGSSGPRVLEFTGTDDFQSQVRGLLCASLEAGPGERPPDRQEPDKPEDDAAFVRHLVMEIVADELGAAAWPEALRGPLLDIQYQSRMKGLSENFPDAAQQILRVEGEPVGWIVVARRQDEIRLVDIAIARDHRGKGIGSARIRELLDDADTTGKTVRLSVGVLNPAVRLYLRMGFRRTGGDVLSYFMERLPGE
jgi:GNAT superfamily N-acetyltransferase